MQRLEMKKGRLGVLVAALVAAIALMFAARQCSSGRIGERPDMFAGGDTLNVAIEISPTGMSLAGDTLSGEYYDLIRQLCREHGVPVKFHPFTRPEDAVEWLLSGRCRLLVGDIPVTAETRESFIFVDPVGLDRQVLVQLRDTTALPDSVAAVTPADGEVEINGRRVPYRLNAPTQFDIAGHSICIPKGSPFRQRLVNLSHEIGDTIIIIEDEDYSSEQLVMLTALGKIPMAVVSHATASVLGRSYPLLDYSVPVSLNQFQSWALAPRDSVLRDSISAWLSH